MQSKSEDEVRCRESTAQRRTAKPKKTLPKRTAMLVAAPGTKVAAAAPVEPPLGAEVEAAPPKPVTGMLFVADPEGADVADMVLEEVELPL